MDNEERIRILNDVIKEELDMMLKETSFIKTKVRGENIKEWIDEILKLKKG